MEIAFTIIVAVHIAMWLFGLGYALTGDPDAVPTTWGSRLPSSAFLIAEWTTGLLAVWAAG